MSDKVQPRAAGELRISDLGDIGRAVRARRDEQGLTLDEAADLYGVGRRLLIELEHGERNVGAGTLLGLLQLLGYDLILRRRGGPAREG